MSVVTEHLEQRGSRFEVIPHRQAYTSVDEARALGIEVGEVLKTLVVRTGSGYALMVIPASRRLDLHLAREATAEHRRSVLRRGAADGLGSRHRDRARHEAGDAEDPAPFDRCRLAATGHTAESADIRSGVICAPAGCMDSRFG